MNGKCRRVPRCVNKTLCDRQLSCTSPPPVEKDSVVTSRRIPRSGLLATHVFFAAAALWSFVVACSPSTPGPPQRTVPEIEPVERPDRFSGALAVGHLRTLSRLAPRTAGSAADRAARDYYAAQFEAAGASARWVEEGSRRHLIAELRGESEDALLLVAAYPSLARGESIGDSGAVLLLELARVLSRETPAYSLHFALADAARESPRAGAASDPSEGVAIGVAGRRSRQRAVQAGESLARALDERDGFERLRGILVFEGTGREALQIARDLRSHPIFREVFWDSARDLGYGDLFPAEAAWASPRSLHLAFVDRTTEGVVAIVDEVRARPELEPLSKSAVESPESLEAVGRVSIEALARIMQRLRRIDAFAHRSAAEPRDPRRDEAAGSTPRSQPVGDPQASPQLPKTPPSS